MVTDKNKYLLIFIFLVITIQLPAQDEPRLTQRFSWSGGEYAFRYEVVFEQLVNSNYVAHSREFITQRFIEVSLSIGDYRFRIIPYDILDKPASASEWRYFKIIPAPPKIETAAHQDTRAELEFIPHYEEEPEAAFEPEPEPEVELEPEPAAVIESQPEVIKNPYALNSVLFSASAFISLQFSLYGKEFVEDISPFNFGARLNVTFRLPLDIYIGPELTANFYQFIVMDEYNMFFLAPGINFLALKWLPNERLAFGTRVGLMYLYYTHDAFTSDNIMPNTGALFRFRVSPIFMIEAGFDYFHIVNIAPGGYIRPWIGVGCQF
jgi:hypothetical protein